MVDLKFSLLYNSSIVNKAESNNVRNLFGEKPVYPDPSYVEPVKVPKEKVIEPAFQVGRTEDNRVSLKIGGDSAWASSLLMNDEGVDALIRMLEAAKNQPLPAFDSEE